jgi:signal transduction histidine kinase
MTDSTETAKANILIVDDTPANLRLLSGMLTERGYKVRSVINGQMALTAARAAPPDLILLDIRMPEMNGYEVCEALKSDERTADVPIIFISALDEAQDKVRAFTAGGVDYVTKPFQFEEVLARVKTHLALCDLRQELEEEIIVRDKLIAELDAYAHTVAHDLKNPLTSLIGYSQLLLRRHARMSEEKLESNLDAINQSARRMANIIEELLLLSSVRKQDEIERSVLDMGAIVDEVQARLADMIGQYEAELVVPDAWPTALGYGPWVVEIWVNYLSNALKYGGRPPRVELGATALDGGEVRFWVRDNGEGLTPEAQAKLFVAFERLGQARAKGHGLGLSIVRRIVDKLDGDVSVESTPGQGSTFGFTLPAAAQ